MELHFPQTSSPSGECGRTGFGRGRKPHVVEEGRLGSFLSGRRADLDEVVSDFFGVFVVDAVPDGDPLSPHGPVVEGRIVLFLFFLVVLIVFVLSEFVIVELLLSSGSPDGAGRNRRGGRMGK